ncbi:hypothetical protein QLX67_05060 [Balneolaceae bacterium ANBcel3]|nr:hypothetical protein [Balneolaceae bacterium ANBcel3]
MGKYAIVLVSTLIVFTMSYTHSLRTVYLQSETRLMDSYGYNQANNLAQAAMMASVRDIGTRDSGVLNIPDEGQIEDTGYMDWHELGGEVRVIITNLGEVSSSNGSIRLNIETIGRFNNYEYRSNVTGFFHPTTSTSNSFQWNTDYGVFTEGGAVFESGTVEGSVATNSTATNSVNLNWGGSRIDGTLQVGPGADPNDVVLIPTWGQQSQFITGGLSNMLNKLEFEMPPFPDYPQTSSSAEPIHVSGSGFQTIYMSDFEGAYIPEINLQGGSRLQIVVDTDEVHRIHVGKLVIGQGFIDIQQQGSGEDRGRLELYVEDQFTIGGSSEINHNGETEDFIMYYGGDSQLSLAGNTRYNGSLFSEKASLDLGGSNAIRGNIITGGDVIMRGGISAYSRMVYAPNGHVRLEGSAQLRGIVVSNTFAVVGGARVIQDDIDIQLPDIPMEGEGDEDILAFQIERWR